jgi:hypothetical protein
MESCTVVKAAVSYSRLSVCRALASATADDCGLGVAFSSACSYHHACIRMRITVLLISVDYQSEPLPFWQIFGNRETVRIRFYYRGEAHILGVEEILSREFSSLAKQQNKKGKLYEKASLNCIGGNWNGFRSRATF